MVSIENGIFTWNMLSERRASPGYFTKTEPEYLDTKYRWEQIRRILSESASRCDIICLQEISNIWKGKLTVFFAEVKYHFVFSGYGNEWDGYMGVGIAYPETYKLNKCFIDRATEANPTDDPRTCLTGTNPFPWKKDRERTERRGESWGDWFLNMLPLSWRTPTNRGEIDVHYEIGRRRNTMVTVILINEENIEFSVSTYHVPCIYGTPKKRLVQLFHSALALSIAYYRSKARPFILAGDFNGEPTDAFYTLFTEGFSEVKFERETEENLNEWLPPGGLDLMKSLPIVSSSLERNSFVETFTVSCKTKRNPNGFRAIHDYIFASDGITLENSRLTSEIDDDDYLPNHTIPSHHVPLRLGFVLGLTENSSP